ncbi:MAG: rhomboid family intramembrane serine protease [Nitrososphaera sp.]
MLRLGNPAPITLGLVIVNIIVFAYGILSNSQNYIISHYGFMPDQLFRYHQTADSVLKIFTSMFIHAGIAHIAFNLFALVYMGGFAERALGKGRYILVYIIAGIGGALFHGVIASYLLAEGQAVLIGASGAISGILGISAAMGDIRGYYWLAIQVLYVFIGSVTSLSIAFAAHVGGFVVGLVFTKFLIDLERQKRMRY